MSYRTGPNWDVGNWVVPHSINWLGCRNCVLLRSFLDHVTNNWLCKLRFSKPAPKTFAHLEENTLPEISPWSTYLWPAAPSVCWQKYQLLIFPLLSRSGLVATATLPNFCFKIWAWVYVSGDYHHTYQNTEGMRPAGTLTVSFNLMNLQLLIKLQPSTKSIKESLSYKTWRSIVKQSSPFFLIVQGCFWFKICCYCVQSVLKSF